MQGASVLDERDETPRRETLLDVIRKQIVEQKRCYIDAEGHAIGPIPQYLLDFDRLRRSYKTMVLSRAFDTKAIAMQRSGRLGTYSSLLGQEAIGVGVAEGMNADDVLLPAHRDGAALIARGIDIAELLRFWGGGKYGSTVPPDCCDFPMCLTVGLHTTHAVGVAYALKLKKTSRVAVCMFGEGATTKGDFWEAINFAAIGDLPVVFVCVNNGWATSLPVGSQTRSETFAQKAIAAGFHGEQVEGNDLIAVRAAIAEATDRARHQAGPTLIEACTYRLSDHSTADDSTKYRSAEEVALHWKEEPIKRLRLFLMNHDAWCEARDDALRNECAEHVNQAAERYLHASPSSVEEFFQHLFETLPHRYENQVAQLRDI